MFSKPLSVLLLALSLGSAAAHEKGIIEFNLNISMYNLAFAPEGIEHAKGRFFVGSLMGGGIITVDNDGKTYPYMNAGIKEGAPMTLVGLETTDDYLYAVASNFPPVRTAAIHVGVYKVKMNGLNAPSTSDIEFIDLTGIPGNSSALPPFSGWFGNDVAVGGGKGYVTDSFQNRIAVFDIDTKKFDSVITDPLFAARSGDPENAFMIGLNGIAYHNDGFVLAARSGNATNAALLKVDIKTSKVTEVSLPQGGSVGGADGVYISAENGNIAYTVSGTIVRKLTTNDGWKSVSNIEEKPVVPPISSGAPCAATTGVEVSGSLRYLCANLNGANPTQGFGPYRIVDPMFRSNPVSFGASLHAFSAAVIAMLAIRFL